MSRRVRVRTGCWTCRFRKKKCDEGRPFCQNCTNLNLDCDGYIGEPAWMKDTAAAQEKKEQIRIQMSRSTRKRRSRTKKIKKEEGDGGLSTDAEKLELALAAQKPSPIASTVGSSRASPVSSYSHSAPVNPVDESDEIGLRTLFLEEGATLSRKNSIESSSQSSNSSEQDVDSGENSLQTIYEIQSLQGTPEPSFPPGRNVTIPEASLRLLVENPDHVQFLKRYLSNILRLAYQTVDGRKMRVFIKETIIPLLKGNDGFRNAALGCGAIQMLTEFEIAGDRSNPLLMSKMQTDAFEFHAKSLSWLNEAVKTPDSVDQMQLLVTILATLNFEIFSCSDRWPVHLKAAREIIDKCGLWRQLTESFTAIQEPDTVLPFEMLMMKRFIWIDIMGSVSSGRLAGFYQQYRACLDQLVMIGGRNLGMQNDLTMIEDSTVLAISEIVHLEVHKSQANAGNFNPTLHSQLEDRGRRLDFILSSASSKRASPAVSSASSPFEYTGTPSTDFVSFTKDLLPGHGFSAPFPDRGSPASSLSTLQSSNRSFPTSTACSSQSSLSLTQTAPPVQLDSQLPTLEPMMQDDHVALNDAYRTAAHIHLFTVMFGTNPHHSKVKQLLESLIHSLSLIPTGTEGYDRSIIYPVLTGASLAISEDDRFFFRGRLQNLTKYGMMPNIERTVLELWRQGDSSTAYLVDKPWLAQNSNYYPSWRNIMNANGWNCILV